VIFFDKCCSKTAIEFWLHAWHKEFTREGIMSLALESKRGPAPLERHTLFTAFRTMKTIGEFEARLHLEFATGEVPDFVHLYVGDEAIAAGVCIHLFDGDRIAGTHRGHGHRIAKGCDLKGMAAEIYGKCSGICGGYSVAKKGSGRSLT
jgi:TPP-dependent pyruvate/acetoin dehydrogenase alpha subunit